jgi:hypothetical protein
MVMASDSQCWHCGQSLTPGNELTKPQPEVETAPSVGTVLRYAGLTAVSLLLLMLTIRAIGQAPLLRISGNSTPLIGWQPFTDNQHQFTLDLPETWQAIDLTTAPETATLKETPPVSTVATSFAALVADSELLFLGLAEDASPTNPAFVLVVRSQRLTRLTADQFVAYAQQQFPENVAVLETDILNNPEQPKGQLLVALQQAEQTWRCQEQFIPDENAVYLVATCARAAQFSDYLTDFETILRSFQPLNS